MTKVIKISIVVPIYNSELIIDELCRRLLDVLNNNFSSFEIILIDDASSDNVVEKMKKWEAHQNIYCFYNKENIGQLLTTKNGIINSKGEYIVTIDDDLEYNPQDILNLYNTIKKEKADVVFGIAEDKYTLQGKSKFIANIRNKFLNSLWNKPITDSFKIINKNSFINDPIIFSEEPFEIFLNRKLNHLSIGYKEVSFNKRYAGKSNYTFSKKIKLLNNINQYYLIFYWGKIISILKQQKNNH